MVERAPEEGEVPGSSPGPSTSKLMITSLIHWAKRYERLLSSLFFLGGFLGDILAFTLLEVEVVNIIFALYVVLGALAIMLSHYLSSRETENSGKWVRLLSLLLPLFVQYVIGSILSGSLIFFTKSATLLVSWPFLLLIAIVFFGNEIFRSYREHLAFQTILFFFGFYAYAIFALPLLVGTIGPLVFLGSSLIAVGVFAVFLLVLYRAGRKRLRDAFKGILLGTVGIVAIINSAYFTNVIPPLPLGLKDVGVYHHISREGDTYHLKGEAPALWWDVLKPTVVHHTAGTPLYVYSAVFAPIRFSAGVVHEWEHKDPVSGNWVLQNRVPFSVSGGRATGYRGYSLKSDPSDGEWRVSIKTAEGQTIGRLEFEVETVQEEPVLVEETR